MRIRNWASGTWKPETSAGISSYPGFMARKGAETQLKNRFEIFGFSDLVEGRAVQVGPSTAWCRWSLRQAQGPLIDRCHNEPFDGWHNELVELLRVHYQRLRVHYRMT
ncbi:MAG: hypothetical protein ACK4VN_07400 [Bacteroidales bacterium]